MEQMLMSVQNGAEVDHQYWWWGCCVKRWEGEDG